MYSNEFKAKMVSTRRIQLEELIKKYSSQYVQYSKLGKNPTPVQLKQVLTTSANNNRGSMELDSEKQVENVVSLGKFVLHALVVEPKEFDLTAFRSTIQQVCPFSLKLC